MTEITHEALNEIADALRRGCDGSIPIEAAEKLECIADALRTGQLIHAAPRGTRKFNLGDRVTKTKGSSWTGLVVGFYSTSLTPIGYAVESENEPGSVQIYPESALQACRKARENGDG